MLTHEEHKAMNEEQQRQAERYLGVERAVERLSKLARHIDAEDLADYLIDRGNVRRVDDAAFVGQWLVDAWEYMRDRRADLRPKCIVCGADELDRPNARYCSDRCRQKAYRQRNGSAAPARGRSVTRC